MSGYDVVVVGARVAGASTAMLLARAGLRVALVERAAYGSDTPSTHALMRAGVLQLSRWGLLDGVVAAGTPPVRCTVFHYKGGATTRVTIRRSAGVDALYAPRRTVLDPMLVDAAGAAGVDLFPDTTVTELVHEGDRVAGVRVVSRHGLHRTLRARFTIGADGIGSVVAAGARAEVLRRGEAATAVLYRYVADFPAEGYEWAYGDAAGAGAIPTNDGQTGVFVGTTAARMREARRLGADHAFASLLEQAAPALVDRFHAARPVSRMHGWAAHPGFVRRSGGPGWALVGDAGYFKDPITAHGITDALRDAELLADEVIASLAGTVPEAVALNRYQATRERLSHRLMDATEQVATYAWERADLDSLMRQVSSAMSDEVEHLQGLPERHVPPVLSAPVPVATAAAPH
jgi:2-polyprenyl-6-methoxyphenol hydroxylase-like FAD-dependent oxidoreductase